MHTASQRKRCLGRLAPIARVMLGDNLETVPWRSELINVAVVWLILVRKPTDRP